MKRWEILTAGGVIACLIGGFAMALMAATYTAPEPRGSRPTWMTNRYAEPAEGLLIVDWTSDDINDVSVSLDSRMAGYIDRIVWEHDGNDGAWTISVADAGGVTLFTNADANAVNDPCSFVCNSPYGGMPFAGGLTLAIADANNGRAWADGDGTAVTVRMYIREAWRR